MGPFNAPDISEYVPQVPLEILFEKVRDLYDDSLRLQCCSVVELVQSASC